MRPPFYNMYNTLMNSMDCWVQKYQAAQDFFVAGDWVAVSCGRCANRFIPSVAQMRQHLTGARPLCRCGTSPRTAGSHPLKKQGEPFLHSNIVFLSCRVLTVKNGKHGIITQTIKIIVIGGRQIIHKGTHLLRGFFRSKKQIVFQILGVLPQHLAVQVFKEFRKQRLLILGNAHPD